MYREQGMDATPDAADEQRPSLATIELLVPCNESTTLPMIDDNPRASSNTTALNKIRSLAGRKLDLVPATTLALRSFAQIRTVSLESTLFCGVVGGNCNPLNPSSAVKHPENGGGLPLAAMAD